MTRREFQNHWDLLRVAIVALAILFAQIQCVAACAGDLCGSGPKAETSAPPCHQHRDDSSHSPAPCNHRLLVSPASLPQSAQVISPILPVLAFSTHPAPVIGDAPPLVSDSDSSSPPLPDSCTVAVLRI